MTLTQGAVPQWKLRGRILSVPHGFVVELTDPETERGVIGFGDDVVDAWRAAQANLRSACADGWLDARFYPEQP